MYKSLAIILVDCPFVFDVCLRRHSTLLLPINQLPVIQNSISHSRDAIYTPGKLDVQLRSILSAVYFPPSGTTFRSLRYVEPLTLWTLSDRENDLDGENESL